MEVEQGMGVRVVPRESRQQLLFFNSSEPGVETGGDASPGSFMLAVNRLIGYPNAEIGGWVCFS